MFSKTLGYLKWIMVLAAIVASGVFMSWRGYEQKIDLEYKRTCLQTENDKLFSEIKLLERDLNQIRNDPKTIEKVAKKKLGMVRRDETVYLLERSGPLSSGFGD
jgi:cell division protein FtsB